MMLVGVQGESTESLSYAQTLQRIKQVGRPLRLTLMRAFLKRMQEIRFRRRLVQMQMLYNNL